MQAFAGKEWIMNRRHPRFFRHVGRGPLAALFVALAWPVAALAGVEVWTSNGPDGGVFAR